LYGLLVRLASRFAATIACVVFMITFAFGQFTRIADYNWLCPYSYELVHGTMCAVAGLWCLDRYHRTRRIAWIAGTGFALGLVVLTKAEPLFAAVPAVAVGLVLTLVAERPDARRTVTLLAAFAGAAAARRVRLPTIALAAVLIAFAVPLWALISEMGWYDSLRPLPLLVGGIAVASLASFVRHRDDVDRAF